MGMKSWVVDTDEVTIRTCRRLVQVIGYGTVGKFCFFVGDCNYSERPPKKTLELAKKLADTLNEIEDHVKGKNK